MGKIMKFNTAILALAIGAFGIGVTEFAPMGMLPVIASDLGVSIPTAGLLVSAYAFGVLLCAPLMTLTTGRVPRRTLLIALMGLFTAGNLLAALSEGYTTLMFARVLTSFCHGAFFGVGAVVAAGLVPQDKRASAVAAMFMGLTIATVGGVTASAGRMLGDEFDLADRGHIECGNAAFDHGADRPGRRIDLHRIKDVTAKACLEPARR